MLLARFDQVCAGLPGAEMVVQWGNAHVWKVGPKVFAIASTWGADSGTDLERAIVFKASALSHPMLLEEPHVVPAPYLSRRGSTAAGGWVQVRPSAALSDDELAAYIAASHSLVAAALTRKQRAGLGMGD